MTARRVLALSLIFVLLGGCAGNPDNIKVAVKMMLLAKDMPAGLYYNQVAGGFNFMPLNTIFYKHEKVKADGSDITILISSASPEFWSEVGKILTGGLLKVGEAAVYGVSIEAAKTAISQASTTTGGSSTNTNTSTGGSSTNTNTNSSRSCSAGDDMGNNNCN